MLLTWNHIHRILWIIILDESKAIHKLDFIDSPGAVAFEMLFNIRLRCYTEQKTRVQTGVCSGCVSHCLRRSSVQQPAAEARRTAAITQVAGFGERRRHAPCRGILPRYSLVDETSLAMMTVHSP